MPKKQLTDAEKHTFNVAMGFRAANGKLKPDSSGHGKGLSTNREENVVKHLVDPGPNSRRPSLLECASLIMLTTTGGQRIYLPFDKTVFLTKVREAQKRGLSGDGAVQVIWLPNKLAEILGGAAANWAAWVQLALGVQGRQDHRFRPIVKMSDLTAKTRKALEAKGTILPGRSRPLVGLTTTAMTAYLMAQTYWPETTLGVVREVQRCVHRQADHLTPLLALPPVEPVEPVDPVSDPAMSDILADFDRDILENLDIEGVEPEPLDPDNLQSVKEVDEMMAQLRARRATLVKQQRQKAWKDRVKDYEILSATPDDDFDLVSTLTVKVDGGRVMILGVLKVIEENILDHLTNGKAPQVI